MDLRAIPDKVSSALGLGSSSEKPTGKTDPTSLAAREKALQEARRADPLHPPTEHELKATPQSEIKWDASKPMLAAEWQGTRKIVVTTRASPCVTDPKDAVVRVTSASVCGTDLHMYTNQVPGEANKSGDIMGHESMGIVESVGDQCTKVKVGDRVIVSAVLCCGECDQCKAGRTSMCPKLNPAADLEKLMGARNAGLLGIGHTNGAYSGGQAERVRIPFADVNLMPLPADKLTDQQLLLLSDVACTGFHGTELADVKEGQTVCIWGGGPVGLMAGMLALKLRKASRVCIIDGNAYRLAFAAKLGMEGVNYHEVDNVVNELMRRFPLGADAGIDCAGYRYPRGMLHKAMRAVRLETDSAEIITEMAQVVRPGGRLALIGEYFGMANAFPIGALMQKDLTLRGGPVYLHQYVPYILSKVQDGTIDLTPWFTHSVDLSDIAEAYRMFDQREDEVLKIHVVTEFGKQRGQLGNKLPLPPKLEESAHATAAAPSK